MMFAQRRIIALMALLALPISFIIALSFGTINIPFLDVMIALFANADNAQSNLVIEHS